MTDDQVFTEDDVETAAWALRVFEQADADPVHFRQSVDHPQYASMAAAALAAVAPGLVARATEPLQAENERLQAAMVVIPEGEPSDWQYGYHAGIVADRPEVAEVVAEYAKARDEARARLTAVADETLQTILWLATSRAKRSLGAEAESWNKVITLIHDELHRLAALSSADPATDAVTDRG